MDLKNSYVRTAILCVLGAALAGCVVGPKYARPDAMPEGPVPGRFAQTQVAETNSPPEQTNEWKIATPIAHLARGAWWQEFGDPELNRIEELASNLNHNLALAVARLDEARALARAARADFYPNVNFAPGYSYGRTSANTANRVNAGETGEAYILPFQASWEIDLWGRVRQQVAASRARLQASEDEIESARLAVQSEVAADYFALSALNAEFSLVEKTIDSFKRSLELTMNRRKGGIATDLDVSQAETQLRTAEALLPSIDLQRIQLRNALATLCGRSPSQFEISPNPLPIAFQPIAPGIPSELLERRPDVAAAERQMAAANAEVGVAQAAFYPRVTLNGLAGLQSINAGTLFNWSSRVWALGPNIDLPIFNAGRNRAELALTRARFAGTVASYRQTVLSAFQEVENQLAAQRLLAVNLAAEEGALTSAQRTLEIAQNRYKSGLVTYIEVAIAQNSALEHERTVVRLRAQRLAARMALIKALGGGWETPELHAGI